MKLFILCAATMLLIVALMAASSEMRSECLESRCASGLQPVWLNRDAECICAERPE